MVIGERPDWPAFVWDDAAPIAPLGDHALTPPR